MPGLLIDADDAVYLLHFDAAIYIYLHSNAGFCEANLSINVVYCFLLFLDPISAEIYLYPMCHASRARFQMYSKRTGFDHNTAKTKSRHTKLHFSWLNLFFSLASMSLPYRKDHMLIEARSKWKSQPSVREFQKLLHLLWTISVRPIHVFVVVNGSV